MLRARWRKITATIDLCRGDGGRGRGNRYQRVLVNKKQCHFTQFEDRFRAEKRMPLDLRTDPC